MKRSTLVLLAVVIICSLSGAAMAVQVPLLNDNFESYPTDYAFVNHNNSTVYTDPIIHTNWYSVSGGMTTGFSHKVIDSGDNATGKVIDFSEDTPTSAGFAFLYHCFKKTYDYTMHAECDVMLPQNTAGFRIALNQITGAYPKSGAQANNGNSWAAAVVFEGNIPWANGAASAPGRISYETGSFSQAWVNSGFTYQPNQWYTVRFEANNVNSASPYTYKVFIGPKGGALSEITPPGGVQWVTRQTAPLTHPGVINAISFGSSDKLSLAGCPNETAGHIYIDRVYVDGNQADTAPATIADLMKLQSGLPGTGVGGTTDPPEPGEYIETFALGGSGGRFRVASVGTDQLGKFFYLVDGDRETGNANPRGIRCRVDLPSIIPNISRTVKQGDVVDISGYIQKATDNGVMTRTEGEKEIYCIQLASYTPEESGQTFAVPKPLGISNRNIGGSSVRFDGLDEKVAGDPFIPGVFKSANPAGGAYLREDGLNNVGTYGKFWGKVTYVSTDPNQKYYPYFYIDDGSGVNDGSLPDGVHSQVGVRVLMNNNRDGIVDTLQSIMGKYVTVTGIAGAISSSDLIPGSSRVNVRVIRLAEELFVDYDGNFVRDWWDPYDDANRNGVYDGIQIVTPEPPAQ